MTSKFKVGDEVVHETAGKAVVVGIALRWEQYSYLIKLKEQVNNLPGRYSDSFEVSHLEYIPNYYHAFESRLSLLTPKFKGN